MVLEVVCTSIPIAFISFITPSISINILSPDADKINSGGVGTKGGATGDTNGGFGDKKEAIAEYILDGVVAAGNVAAPDNVVIGTPAGVVAVVVVAGNVVVVVVTGVVAGIVGIVPGGWENAGLSAYTTG